MTEIEDDPILKELINREIKDDGKAKLPCRNCSYIYAYDNLHAVQGYRFCDRCYNKMKEIGQIIQHPDRGKLEEVMLWQGDPFHKDRHQDDPYPHMSKHQGRNIWE